MTRDRDSVEQEKERARWREGRKKALAVEIAALLRPYNFIRSLLVTQQSVAVYDAAFRASQNSLRRSDGPESATFDFSAGVE